MAAGVIRGAIRKETYTRHRYSQWHPHYALNEGRRMVKVDSILLSFGTFWVLVSDVNMWSESVRDDLNELRLVES